MVPFCKGQFSWHGVQYTKVMCPGIHQGDFVFTDQQVLQAHTSTSRDAGVCSPAQQRHRAFPQKNHVGKLRT